MTVKASSRRREALHNLQLLLEAYLREESGMRWGSTPGQIRAAAKQMVRTRQVPAALVARLNERLELLRNKEVA